MIGRDAGDGARLGWSRVSPFSVLRSPFVVFFVYRTYRLTLRYRPLGPRRSFDGAVHLVYPLRYLSTSPSVLSEPS